MSKRQRGPLPKFNHEKPTPHHVRVQFANIRSKDTVLKVARMKNLLMYRGKNIRITSDLSTHSWNERKGWGAFLKLFQKKHAAKDPLSRKAVIQN